MLSPAPALLSTTYYRPESRAKTKLDDRASHSLETPSSHTDTEHIQHQKMFEFVKCNFKVEVVIILVNHVNSPDVYLTLLLVHITQL